MASQDVAQAVMVEPSDTETVEESFAEKITVLKKQKKKKKKKEKKSVITIFRDLCGIIVNNSIFQYVILALIVVNAAMMGIGTYDFVEDNESLSNSFDVADNVFLIIFTVELCLNFVHLGFNLFRDGWLVFDFITIVLSWSSDQLQVIRAFRVFRALRLITKIEVLKKLVMALLNVLPRMGAILSLMILILYIFAVMFTSLFKDVEIEDEEVDQVFRNLQSTLFTLFQFMTLDWTDITRVLMDVVPWARYPICIFIMITGFIVYNLIVAVLCDAIYELNEMKKKDAANLEAEDDSVLNDEDGPRLQKKIDEVSNRIYRLEASQKQMYTMVENLSEYLTKLEKSLEYQKLQRESKKANK